MNEVIIDRQESFPICSPEGREVGVVELFNYSPFNDRAELGLEIEPEWRGKGLGTKAVIEMMKYAKEELLLHTIYVTIEEDNIASLKIFRKLGFEETTLKNWYREGEIYKNGKLLQYTL